MLEHGEGFEGGETGLGGWAVRAQWAATEDGVVYSCLQPNT